MSFPKTGKFLQSEDEASFALMVSSVLRGTLGERPASIKRVARWTGAGERTVKNWFAGTYAPRGHHFQNLVRYCPEMLEAFLISVDRRDRLILVNICDVRNRIIKILQLLDALTEHRY